MKYEQNLGRSETFGSVLVIGFAAAVAVWCAWFTTHLPWLGVAEQTSIPLLGGVWVAAIALGASKIAKSRAILIGALAGAVCSTLGLLILGSKLTHAPDASGVSAGLKPAAGLIALGFLGLGTLLGGVGGAIGMAIGRGTPPAGRERWLARFALVACVAIAPLLFVGGLVTSTNSGMAVPDWPNTYGSNMFLYPLGPRVELKSDIPYWQVFLEHSHRLFGTLIGLTTLTLMVLVFAWEKSRWIRGVAVAAFVLVCLQGLLGGQRVALETWLTGSDPAKAVKIGRWLAMGHGVLAQLVFGVVVALAVYLSPAYRAFTPTIPPLPRKLRVFSTALLHSLILQLIFGAMYRHLRSDHALYSHIGFSIIVVVFALAAGFSFTSDPVRRLPAGRSLSLLGKALVTVVAIQFILGWATFGFGGSGHQAASHGQALIRTAHQANGAVLLALATATFIWGRRLCPRSAPPAPATQIHRSAAA